MATWDNDTTLEEYINQNKRQARRMEIGDKCRVSDYLIFGLVAAAMLAIETALVWIAVDVEEMRAREQWIVHCIKSGGTKQDCIDGR